jgi:hypothetical protein
LILTAHQPAYLPWLGFFHKIILSDTYVILDEVQFEKSSFINRNKIKTPEGSQWLTVPVFTAGYRSKTILDMEINNTEDWKISHWNGLYRNYKKAPYFHLYSDFFNETYKQQWTNLTDLLIYTMEFFFKEMKINTKVIRQSELYTKNKKQDLIIELCKKLNADKFVFGALGRNYAQEEIFKNNGIQIYFQDYQHPSYKQQWGEFISHLSIVDLLFNLGAENALDIIMMDNIDKKSLETLLNNK